VRHDFGVGPRTTDPLLHQPGRRAYRLVEDWARLAARQGGQLADPPGIRLGEPRLASVARELTRDHTVLRYDARGSGLSDWDATEISFEVWLRDLETVVDAAGLERFPLLGLSQGGSVAVAYAASHPERVTHLVLHGAYLRGPARRSGGAPEREEAELLVKLAELGWGKPNPAFRQFFTTQFIPDGTPEQHEWWNELQRRSCSPGNASRYLAAINAIDVTALAPQVTCPTLVLHSTHDARVPFEEGRLAAGLIPGARFVPFESRNHVLLGDERCWPRWLSEVRGFLSSRATHEGSFRSFPIVNGSCLN
jgi:pimeloyl-ACP methyl ester carboxylesterase